MDIKDILESLPSIVYRSIIGITEGELECGSITHEDGSVEEVEKTYFGNGHHLAQRIVSDVEVSIMGRHLYKGDVFAEGLDVDFGCFGVLHKCILCPIFYEMTCAKNNNSFTGNQYEVSYRMTTEIIKEIKTLIGNEK